MERERRHLGCDMGLWWWSGAMGGADQVTLWSDYDLYTNIVIVAAQWDPGASMLQLASEMCDGTKRS